MKVLESHKKASLRPMPTDPCILARTKLANIINMAQRDRTTHHLLGIEVHDDISRRLPLKISPNQISFSCACGRIIIATLSIDPAVIANLIGLNAVHAIMQESEAMRTASIERAENSDPYEIVPYQISMYV
jgi:hypothetical protein